MSVRFCFSSSNFNLFNLTHCRETLSIQWRALEQHRVKATELLQCRISASFHPFLQAFISEDKMTSSIFSHLKRIGR